MIFNILSLFTGTEKKKKKKKKKLAVSDVHVQSELYKNSDVSVVECDEQVEQLTTCKLHLRNVSSTVIFYKVRACGSVTVNWFFWGCLLSCSSLHAIKIRGLASILCRGHFC